MKPLRFLFLILLISCGGNEKHNCKTREQKRILCLAQMIEQQPEGPWDYEFYKRYCEDLYQYEGYYCE